MIQNSLIFFQDATGRSTLQFDATRKSASQNLMNSIYLYLYLYIYVYILYIYVCIYIRTTEFTTSSFTLLRSPGKYE